MYDNGTSGTKTSAYQRKIPRTKKTSVKHYNIQCLCRHSIHFTFPFHHRSNSPFLCTSSRDTFFVTSRKVAQRKMTDIAESSQRQNIVCPAMRLSNRDILRVCVCLCVCASSPSEVGVLMVRIRYESGLALRRKCI